jgi:hypothetical protein
MLLVPWALLGLGFQQSGCLPTGRERTLPDSRTNVVFGWNACFRGGGSPRDTRRREACGGSGESPPSYPLGGGVGSAVFFEVALGVAPPGHT